MSETKEREKKCEERIDNHLESTILDFTHALHEEWQDGEEYEDFIEWLNSYCLNYASDPHFRAMKLELSWGGPSDFFLFFDDGTIEYHFQDWGDGAKRELYGNDLEIMSEVYDEYLNI